MPDIKTLAMLNDQLLKRSKQAHSGIMRARKDDFGYHAPKEPLTSCSIVWYKYPILGQKRSESIKTIEAMRVSGTVLVMLNLQFRTETNYMNQLW